MVNWHAGGFSISTSCHIFDKSYRVINPTQNPLLKVHIGIMFLLFLFEIRKLKSAINSSRHAMTQKTKKQQIMHPHASIMWFIALYNGAESWATRTLWHTNVFSAMNVILLDVSNAISLLEQLLFHDQINIAVERRFTTLFKYSESIKFFFVECRNWSSVKTFRQDFRNTIAWNRQHWQCSFLRWQKRKNVLKEIIKLREFSARCVIQLKMYMKTLLPYAFMKR